MMLTSQGVVKLMDFGIARPSNEAAALTVTGTALGSLNYMSPEQVKGVPVDPRSDLYSVGVSLYEMVTGQLPFRGTSNYSLMSAHLEDKLLPAPIVTLRPGTPQALNDIILMAMAKDPNARFQSAEAFRNALGAVDPNAVTAMPSSATRAATPMPRPAPYSPPVAATQPAPQPVMAAAAVAASGQPAKSHRALYMVLGALILLVVLSAAGYYVPRHFKTQASPDSSTAATSTTQPASSTPTPEQLAAIVAAQQAADAAAAQKEQEQAAAAAANKPHNGEAADAQADKERAAGLAQAEAERQAALKRDAELAEDEKQSDQLDARAAAITASLDNLRRGQAQQGLGLRGDMAAAEQLMHTNLSRAQSAIEAKDPEKAMKYLDSAEMEAEQLEHFLGR